MTETSRVTGILSWYDEPVELLAAHVSSLVGVIDHLVAVDGAYALFPEGQPSSDPEQARVITEICRGARIGLTMHVPTHLWYGNEVAKRNYTLHLAEAVTQENGWYIVLDADCIITTAVEDWFEVVRTIPDDYGAAEIGVREIRTIPGVEFNPAESWSKVRLMYRALRGLEYGPAHWILRGPDPETGEPICLWGFGDYEPVDAFDLTRYLKIDHRHDRPAYRVANALRYYERRERLGIEKTSKIFTRHLDGRFAEHNPPRE